MARKDQIRHVLIGGVPACHIEIVDRHTVYAVPVHVYRPLLPHEARTDVRHGPVTVSHKPIPTAPALLPVVLLQVLQLRLARRELIPDRLEGSSARVELDLD